MKRVVIIPFALFLIQYCVAQNIELGYGQFSSSQRVFHSGTSFHAGMGYKINKLLMLGINCDYLQAPDINTYHGRLINHGSWNKPLLKPDTFYDVQQRNAYQMLNVLFCPRFYGSVNHKGIDVFLSIPLGLSMMTEKVNYTGNSYNTSSKYIVHAFTCGVEMGVEIAITKSRKLCLQASGSALFIQSENFVTDIYMPPFSSMNTMLFNSRIGLTWYPRRKYLKCGGGLMLN